MEGLGVGEIAPSERLVLDALAMYKMNYCLMNEMNFVLSYGLSVTAVMTEAGHGNGDDGDGV